MDRENAGVLVILGASLMSVAQFSAVKWIVLYDRYYLMKQSAIMTLYTCYNMTKAKVVNHSTINHQLPTCSDNTSMMILKQSRHYDKIEQHVVWRNV